MSGIKYTLDFDRIAVIPTPKGKMNVGRVKSFEQRPDGTIDVEIEFNPLVPKRIVQALQKNPDEMGIEIKGKIAKNIILVESS
jgi:hypothetical protein